MSTRRFAIHAADERGLGAPGDRVRERRRADLRAPNAFGSTPQPGG